MHEHVVQMAPEEACGLVAGHGSHSRSVYSITNRLRSKTRFDMEPNQLLAALYEIDIQGWELMAIYHSHPSGPAHPTATDIAEAHYHQAAHLIWFRSTAMVWRCQAYSLLEGEIKPVQLILTT